MIGIDLVSLARFQKVYDKYQNKLIDKILTENEKKMPISARYLAVSFCAKEAFSKAIKTGITKECNFKDVEVLRDENGVPRLELSPFIKEKFNILDTDISITHDAGFIISVVVVLKSQENSKKFPL